MITSDSQSDPGIKINSQPFTYRIEKGITQEISPIRESVINLDVHNPLPQPGLHPPVRSLSTRSITDYK